MEPTSERSSFVPPAPFPNASAISATAPVLTEDTVSSPGVESVPIFTSGLLCSSAAMLTSNHEPAPSFFSSHDCFGLHDIAQSGYNNAETIINSDACHNQSSNENIRPSSSAPCIPNENELLRCSSVFIEGQQQNTSNKNAFGARCLRRQHAANPCRHGPMRYLPKGSSSSISSRSSSSSPGTNRRYSNAKSCSSTDEDMSTNPNTPNTPITPLTPGDVNGDALNKAGTIFNFPVIDSRTVNSSNINSNNNLCNINDKNNQSACVCEGLDLDLDLDDDDDVFCSDLSAIPTTITPFSTNITTALEPTIAGSCSMRNQQNHNNGGPQSCLGNKNTIAAATGTVNTTSTTNVNCSTDSVALFSSAFLSHHQPDSSYVTRPRTGENDLAVTCSNSHASTNSPSQNSLPALLSDALQVCQKDELGETPDPNNNNSSGSDRTDALSPSSSPNPALLSAALEAYQSGQITPLLKHELKWVIQLRRLSQGKEEMEVSFEPPTVAQVRFLNIYLNPAP